MIYDLRVRRVLEQAALKGDLQAARDLAILEMHDSFTTNLDACPPAADAYEAVRAHYRAFLD